MQRTAKLLLPRCAGPVAGRGGGPVRRDRRRSWRGDRLAASPRPLGGSVVFGVPGKRHRSDRAGDLVRPPRLGARCRAARSPPSPARGPSPSGRRQPDSVTSHRRTCWGAPRDGGAAGPSFRDQQWRVDNRAPSAPMWAIPMPSRRHCRSAALAVLALLPLASLAAQARWEGPRPPCNVSPGHFRVEGGVLYLRTAAEKAGTRTDQLAQAKRVLTQAIVQDQQEKNPGAWYFLGRYYFEANDASGADTAFARAEALAPQCKQDIGSYRQRLWQATLGAGVEAWQGGKPDSAVPLLQLAARLQPANPKAYGALAGLYSGENELDSAAAYYRKTAAAAGSDTAFAGERRDALMNGARLALGTVQASPAAQEFLRLPATRDSSRRGMAADSAVLAKLTASAQSRAARHAHLTPGDQQVFSRDSSARAQGIAQRRAMLVALDRKGAEDST